MIRLVVVDSFDFFIYNLVECFSEQTVEDEPLGIETRKNTALLDEICDLDPDAIAISPGPGHPKNDCDVGVTNGVLTELSAEIPTFGVCPGLGAAACVYGGTIGHAPGPIHGKAFPVDHDGAGVFAGLEDGFPAERYHSLVAADVPDCFGVSATTDHDGEALVMGVRHHDCPIECVQLHPKSVLTGSGHGVVRNFLTAVAGFDVA